MDPHESERALDHGRRLAPRQGATHPETGSDSDTGMPPDRRDVSTRPGDSDAPEAGAADPASQAQSPPEDYPGDTPSDAAPADRTTL